MAQVMALRQHGEGDGLYSRLQLPLDASHDEVARAYRRLAHDAHPDARPGDPDAARRFREITEAYEVLGNPEKREQYDRTRRQPGARPNWACPPPRERPPKPRATAVFPTPAATGGPPVFLGTGPATGRGPELYVGPVQVVPGPSPAAPVSREDVATALLAELLADIFGTRWRP